jgi:hypothetical protein
MKPQKKVINDGTSEYDISIVIPFPVVMLSKPQKNISQSISNLYLHSSCTVRACVYDLTQQKGPQTLICPTNVNGRPRNSFLSAT